MATKIENAEDAICLLWYLGDTLKITQRLCRQNAQHSFIVAVLERLADMEKAIRQLEEVQKERYRQITGRTRL